MKGETHCIDKLVGFERLWVVAEMGLVVVCVKEVETGSPIETVGCVGGLMEI